MSLFLLCASILFLLLGIIWKNNTLTNVICRIIMFGMGIWGLVLWLISQGYMFK